MRILILGGDGYLGWPTAMRFSQRGHDVHVVDNYLRRRAHAEAGTDSLTPDPRRPPGAGGGVGRGVRSHGRGDRGRPHRPRRGARRDRRVRSGRDRALRRDAERALLDEGPPPRRLHADQQRRGHAERAVGDARPRAGVPPGEARHDGRVRHARHRHRGGVPRDRPQRTLRLPPVPEGAGVDVPPVEGPRLPQHPLRVPGVGAPGDRPEPGRRLRHPDRRDARWTTGWPRGSTTTTCSGRR